MAGENHGKLNHLLRNWPTGTVGTLTWLETQGVYQQLAHDYKKNGWIEQIGRGAYCKAGDPIRWPGALHAIQFQLDLPIHVGGKSALELRGYEHFVATGEGAYLYLFSDKPTRLPFWFTNYRWERRPFFKSLRLFQSEAKIGLTRHTIGTLEIEVASPERAILEVLELVPKHQSYEEARLLMEGLVGLRSKVVQSLLEQCKSIKAKRLFLHLAERCNHPWVAKLDHSKIKLGSGKRVIVPGGKLDTKYQITIDREPSSEGTLK